MNAAELAQRIGAKLVGDPKIDVLGIASVASARPGDCVFVGSADPQRLAEAFSSAAAVIITGRFAESPAENLSKPLLLCDHPRLTFSRAARALGTTSKSPPKGSRHPSAAIASTAHIAASAAIGPHASIADNVAIGERVSIDAGVSIGEGVRIGDDTRIAAGVHIYAGTMIGRRVIVHSGAVLGSDGFGYVRDAASGHYEQFPQVGTLNIADDVEIGANTTIDRGALDSTEIGRGTKIDNLVHIAHNVRIGADVIIAAQTGVSGSTVIEDGAVIGGQVGIGDHARIGAGVILGSGSGVLTGKEVTGSGTIFWGIPARPLRQHLKQLAAVARLAKRSEKK